MSKRFYNCEGVPDNTEVTLSVSSRRSPVTTSSGNSSPVLQNLSPAFPLSQACKRVCVLSKRNGYDYH